MLYQLSYLSQPQATGKKRPGARGTDQFRESRSSVNDSGIPENVRGFSKIYLSTGTGV